MDTHARIVRIAKDLLEVSGVGRNDLAASRFFRGMSIALDGFITAKADAEPKPGPWAETRRKIEKLHE